ncbi:alpha/beta hydrolase [Acrocarpospora corrugata]|uniref:Alpha/beta hydrolase n=1 Tax=Acrocarpospora corrugata TaxID=35763 RepID=A0A5M3W229_9ACTN|nr:alpha/beta hydrolase fold domain-containing protein [Acrocarpospora corrugata]GES03157.1 alpha/beta hydrolase [Acrocarpospora corrugata]
MNPMSVWVSQVMGHPVEVPFPASIDDLLFDRGQNRFLHLNVDLPASVDVHEGVVIGERSLTAEIYVPHGAQDLPVLLFAHGGAWFKGSAEDERKLGMQIAEKGLVVVNLDYALAPEFPFPAGLDDVVEAVHWIAGNITGFGGSPGRIALAGASAGGNLAAAAAGVLCADPAAHPRVSALVLLYGIYDLGPIAHFPGPNPVFESYLGENWRDRVSDPRVSPIQADLQRFPPTYVSCGSEDQALGLSLAMVGALAGAGVEVTVSVVAGANHVFLNIPDVIPGAAPELDRITAWLVARLSAEDD